MNACTTHTDHAKTLAMKIKKTLVMLFFSVLTFAQAQAARTIVFSHKNIASDYFITVEKVLAADQNHDTAERVSYLLHLPDGTVRNLGPQKSYDRAELTALAKTQGDQINVDETGKVATTLAGVAIGAWIGYKVALKLCEQKSRPGETLLEGGVKSIVSGFATVESLSVLMPLGGSLAGWGFNQLYGVFFITANERQTRYLLLNAVNLHVKSDQVIIDGTDGLVRIADLEKQLGKLSR